MLVHGAQFGESPNIVPWRESSDRTAFVLTGAPPPQGLWAGWGGGWPCGRGAREIGGQVLRLVLVSVVFLATMSVFLPGGSWAQHKPTQGVDLRGQLEASNSTTEAPTVIVSGAPAVNAAGSPAGGAATEGAVPGTTPASKETGLSVANASKPTQGSNPAEGSKPAEPAVSNAAAAAEEAERALAERKAKAAVEKAFTKKWKMDINKLTNPMEPKLRPTHTCAKFQLPIIPYHAKPEDRKSCPVCYLDTKEAIALRPKRGRPGASPILKRLTYVTENDECEKRARQRKKNPRFDGYQSMKHRAESFQVKQEMRVHCGFTWGGPVGTKTGYDSNEEDRKYMQSCKDIVVASGIFGASDDIFQPKDISDRSLSTTCFVMFVDQVSFDSFLKDGSLKPGSKSVGLWRLVIVKNMPYTDPRRTGKIPKLLSHRLFPNAQFSIWVDGKLQLRRDPYKLLEKFLWRGNYTWAISRHYLRFDIWEEAQRNKDLGKYDNKSIDAQVNAYVKDGATKWSLDKWPIISDIPEGCVIIREHTPLTNLLACTWFNEVSRFTSRDQLSFAYSQDNIRKAVPRWNINMFLDCERRNMVIQNEHKFSPFYEPPNRTATT